MEENELVRAAWNDPLVRADIKTSIENAVREAFESWLRGPGGQVVRDGVENAVTAAYKGWKS